MRIDNFNSHHEVEEESPYVSFTDLLVGFVFIMILLIVLLFMYIEEEKEDLFDIPPSIHEEQEGTDQNSEQAATNPEDNNDFTDNKEGFFDTAQKLSDELNGLKQMLGTIADDLQRAGHYVTVNKEGDALVLSRGIHFDTGSANLSSEGEETVYRMATALAEVLPCSVSGITKPNSCSIEAPRIESVIIEGHTDAQPRAGTNDVSINWALSTNRAESVLLRVLEVSPILKNAKSYGSPSKGLFGIMGFAHSRPSVFPRIRKDESADRRVLIRFLLTRDLAR